MYGTVAHARVLSGHEGDLVTLVEEWTRERKPKIKGAVGGYVFKPDKNPDEVIIVAAFEDRDSYVANASDPEQDRWYRRMREHLADDPVWEDGEIIATT